MGLDVNGNDNSPEWGWCKTEGCRVEAFPIWTSGDYPDDPDLLLCPKHLGLLIAALEAERDLYLVNEPILKELEALRELRDDVQRWRDGGGDVRDLGYVLETLKKVNTP